MEKQSHRLWSRALLRTGGVIGLCLVAYSCSSSPPSPTFEYLHVTIEGGSSASDKLRTVVIDGQEMGQTAELIEFEGGRCVVTLDRPSDYRPKMFDIDVNGTSSLTPKELVFQRN